MHEVTEQMKADSEYFVSPRPDMGIVIFGRAWTQAEVESYGDSWRDTDYKQNGGYIFGEWSSLACVEGELGSNHVTRCMPISREAYDTANAHGWDIDIVIATVV